MPNVTACNDSSVVLTMLLLGLLLLLLLLPALLSVVNTIRMLPSRRKQT